MDKFLFLDVDGVLNHEKWYEELHRMSKDDRPNFPISEFDPNCVRRVWQIINETAAKLVISSSWRLDNYLYKTFEKVGLPKEFGVTPYLYSYSKISDNDGTEYDYESFEHPCRGHEIKKYLDEHPHSNYCIIDDDEDMLEEQMDHFVKTVGELGDGLNDECMKKAIEILNR